MLKISYLPQSFFIRPNLNDIYPPVEVHEEILKRFMPRIVREIRTTIDRLSPNNELRENFIRELEIFTDFRTGTLNKVQFIISLLFDVVKRISPSQEDFISPGLAYDIIDAYEQAGYVYQYYGFMNIHHPNVQARLGQLVLEPRSFENGVTSSLEMYPHVLEVIADPPPIIEFDYDLDDSILLPGTVSQIKVDELTIPSPVRLFPNLPKWESIPGWKKKDLRNAIANAVMKSGLAVQDDRGKWVLPGEKIGITVGRTFAVYHTNNPNYDGYQAFSGNLPGILNNVNMNLPRGRGNAMGTPYMPRAYYETIYRKLFNTPIYIDWREYCRRDKPKYVNLLRFLAINDFDYSISDIKQLSFQELCQKLSDESLRRRNIRLAIGREAIELGPQIIYQPGSAFVKPERPELFASIVREQRIRHEYEVEQACQDPNVSKGYLTFLANRMGIRNLLPPNLNNVSKEQICRILQRYVGILEESRKPI